jgi:MoxR-like ATPase
MDENISFKNTLDVSEIEAASQRIYAEMGKVIVGQHDLIKFMWIAILCDKHILIEGVPGLAKTLAAKLMAGCIASGFSRIQFTPDLMPSDITGTNVFNMSKSEFQFNRGPVFSNLILIDEINRAPAKTQSALFEVMEERQLTIDGVTYPMSRPFIVIATQNPIEHEGTYRLPEAQIDRFLFKIKLDYPSYQEELQILEGNHNRQNTPAILQIKPVVEEAQLIRFQDIIPQVFIDEKIRNYIVHLIHQTRSNPAVYFGASPRASIFLMNASKACAAVNGRDFVIPEDIQFVIYPLLQHRIILTPEKELEGRTNREVISMIVQSVEVPR